MKILVVGDLHYKGQSLGMLEKLEKEILRTVDERRPDMVVLLGDIMDRHETVHTDYFNAAVNFLQQLAAQTTTYVLMGNHDLVSNRVFFEPRHAFNALKSTPNLYIIDKGVIVDGIDKTRFAFIPYVPPGMFNLAVENTLCSDTNIESLDIIFAHQEFKGAAFGGINSLSPDTWPDWCPLVVSGHIHERQQLQPNLLYTGTPIQQSFGESEDKSVSWFDNATGSFIETRLYLNTPKRITVDCHVSEAASELGNITTENLYRFRLSCTTPEWTTFKKSKVYKDLTLKGVKVLPVVKQADASVSKKTGSKKTYLQILEEMSVDKGINSVFKEIIHEDSIAQLQNSQESGTAIP